MFPFVLWTFCDWQNSISLPLLQQVGSFVVVVVLLLLFCLEIYVGFVNLVYYAVWKDWILLLIGQYDLQ
jgi:hypothetical protein